MVNASGWYGASSQSPSGLQTCRPPLPGSRSRMVKVPEVGVRPDPELAVRGRPGQAHRRVPVDVHGVRRVAGVPGEELGRLPQRHRGDGQQFVGQCAHPGQIAGHARPEFGDLLGKDVVREPVFVDVRDTGLGVRAHRERLLQVRWGGRALGVPVRLHTGRQPAPATHRHRIGPLDLVGEGKEPPRRGSHPGPLVGGDAVPGQQEEPHRLQCLVDLVSHVPPVPFGTGEPRRQIDRRDAAHGAAHGAPRQCRASKDSAAGS